MICSMGLGLADVQNVNATVYGRYYAGVSGTNLPDLEYGLRVDAAF